MFPTPQILSSALSKLSTPFRRSQLGLFHGKTKQYGNNVPHSKHKTRRTWLPNVHTKRLMSDALGRDLKVKLTTRALKSINKHGGVDNYLLRTKPDLLGMEGMRLRILVRERLDVKRAEDEALAQAQAKIQLEKEMKEAKQKRRAQAVHARKTREVRQNITGGIFGSVGSSTHLNAS
ncbi:uncharacterized protein F5147DRAFT_717951 [Suillus discolor]|uniref:Large ribosomal subunit protein bL28c n=1 Tax=Suillus discolor TaxID=1912936 RepID=A0A9P7EY86_9AGAM|nr:uncharacterized protein F5147DRAFT_717951 [Suillus discolor]KAG2095714.1 hypothetical protein F5147DRAFT_717951 [Suillus discolor]